MNRATKLTLIVALLVAALVAAGQSAAAAPRPTQPPIPDSDAEILATFDVTDAAWPAGSSSPPSSAAPSTTGKIVRTSLTRTAAEPVVGELQQQALNVLGVTTVTAEQQRCLDGHAGELDPIDVDSVVTVVVDCRLDIPSGCTGVLCRED